MSQVTTQGTTLPNFLLDIIVYAGTFKFYNRVFMSHYIVYFHL